MFAVIQILRYKNNIGIMHPQYPHSVKKQELITHKEVFKHCFKPILKINGSNNNYPIPLILFIRLGIYPQIFGYTERKYQIRDRARNDSRILKDGQATGITFF